MPTFLYIGAEKAGSTWIYKILMEHPEVFVPMEKDIDFFDKHYWRGMDWYASFFKNGGKAKAIGEVSHDYFLSKRTARRIYNTLADIKLICCLREPFDRTVSAYLFYRKIDVGRDTVLEEFAVRDHVLKCNDYYNNLCGFYKLFGKERILVLFFDELKDNPVEFVERIYEFIGVNEKYIPPSINLKVLSARVPRCDKLAHLVYSGAQFARKRGLLTVLGVAKRNSILSNVLYKKVDERPEFSLQFKEEVGDKFRGDHEKLAELIGRALPESWKE